MPVINFSPGPAAIPQPVKARIFSEAQHWQGRELAVFEVSHRSVEFIALQRKLLRQLRALLEIPTSHELLLLPGGARGQFSAVPLNLSRANTTALYIISGYWSNQAARLAAPLLQLVPVLYDSDAQGQELFMPQPPFGAELANLDPKSATSRLTESELSTHYPTAAYLHCCYNETIDGLQLPKLPAANTGIPLIADISSCIAAIPLDFGRMALAYACFQKNLGLAGLTLVSIAKQLLAQQPRPETPSVLNYQLQLAADSQLNTPATFSIYVASLICEWLADQGGIAEIGKLTQAKAKLLYQQLDESDNFYSNQLDQRYRSLTNVVFHLPTPALEAKFLKAAEEHGFLGLGGHKVQGGVRASLYNAISLAAVEKLCAFMAKFRHHH